MEDRDRLLVLGMGRISGPLIAKATEIYHVTIAGEEIDKIKARAKGVDNVTYAQVDVRDFDHLSALMTDYKLAVSYVPPDLHHHVLKAGLAANTHVVTPSYIYPEMEVYHEEAKAKDLVFLNGMGADPGLDILYTCKIKNEVESQGGKIIGYESWIGGIPDASSATNPLGFKIGWSTPTIFRNC